MENQNYTTSFVVEQTPGEVFAAIINPRAWWSEEIEGDTDKLGEFHYHFQDVHKATIQITEIMPEKKVVWHVSDNYFSFTKDTKEWTGNNMVFEIVEEDGKTKVTFTQIGLVPEYECYDVCSNAWTTYINGSLKNLITTGTGQPNSATQARTDTEAEILKSKAN